MTDEQKTYMYGKFEDDNVPEVKKERQNGTVVAKDFRITFSDFGDPESTSRNFGRHVQAISLPAIHFTCRRLSNSANESVYTADCGTWSPVSITLRDDTSNEMMYQVMRQIQKQRIEPKESHFSFTTELLYENSSVAYRRYIHTGCTILTLGHDVELDRSDPRSVAPCLQVNVDKIDTTGWTRDRDADWLVDVEDDVGLDMQTFLGIGDPVYAPIKR